LVARFNRTPTTEIDGQVGECACRASDGSGVRD
jgi:hypothetical protein